MVGLVNNLQINNSVISLQTLKGKKNIRW